ncbi:MAG: hypothetical protein ACYSVY_25690 [Planctomycetota bacterium]|jgi:hypothetical protein
MLKGTLVAFGIMLASLPVPIVHFFTIPIGPFVAGFFGGGIARADEGRVLVFGLLVAALMLIPAAALLVTGLLADGDVLGLNRWLVVSVAAAVVPYTCFGVTFGALVSHLLRMKEQKAAASDSR